MEKHNMDKQKTWKTKKDVISRATSGHPFVFVLGTGIEPILQD